MSLFMNEKEKRARELALSRPESEIFFRKRPDRVGIYFKKYLDNFIFDEFSASFIKKSEGKLDFMKGVPIPLRKEDLEEFKSDNGLSMLIIAENMAWIIGIDPKFKYAEQYIEYMKANFGKKIDSYLSKEAKDAGELEKYDDSAIHFRASLCVHPDYLDSMYGYARSCRKLYEESNDPEYIGKFKAEAFDYFELTTQIFPKFAQAYYYLGYMYLNMGLYSKAELTWKTFIQKSQNGKDRKEVKERIKQIQVPLHIEQGYNHVIAGRWADGIEILEGYLQTDYKEWWPLSYYLGVAYANTGKKKDAIHRLEWVLKLNPSHVETMHELADIYEKSGSMDKVKKYRDKAKLIESGGHGAEDDNLDLDEGLTESIIEDDILPDTNKSGVKRLKKLESNKKDSKKN